MAPSARPSKPGLDVEEDESHYGVQKGDRKTRKPLVERKRRARINESLQELRTLLADTDFHSKMENAEVLEMTVKKVEDVLKNRTQGLNQGMPYFNLRFRAAGHPQGVTGHIPEVTEIFNRRETDALSREASERFAAGYIQCMHEVHTFVSSCPGIDATVAAELLNHLLECMPLNEDHLQDVLMDLITDTPGSDGGTWRGGDDESPPRSTPASPGGRSVVSSGGSSSPLSPGPSSESSEDPGSDLDETDSEHSQSSTEGPENREALSAPAVTTYPRPMWRPW